MDLREAKQILNKHNFLLEDEYMDSLEKENDKFLKGPLFKKYINLIKNYGLNHGWLPEDKIDEDNIKYIEFTNNDYSFEVIPNEKQMTLCFFIRNKKDELVFSCDIDIEWLEEEKDEERTEYEIKDSFRSTIDKLKYDKHPIKHRIIKFLKSEPDYI